MRIQLIKFAFISLISAILLTGCGSEPSPPPPPTAAVTVVTLRSVPVLLTRELPGRTTPFLVAEVRPQASGIVERRLFTEGSLVKAGEPLYQIDDASYRADASSARASLARAEAAQTSARLAAKRIAELAAIDAVSAQDNENAIAAQRQAEADVGVARAALEGSDVALRYTRIVAPIDGRIGKSSVTQGALVTANQSEALATVQQLDPIYADFTQSITEMHRLRRAVESGELDRIAPDAMKVRLQFDNGELYPLSGKLLFSEAKVDAQTGQVTLRGEFPNPKRELLPGMYVRVQLEQGIDSDAIAVPEQAIQRNSGGGSEVYVVRDDGRVTIQPVKIGSQQDGMWFVTDGLKSGDKVVVEGFQKFTPGDKVKTQSWVEADASADIKQPPTR